MRASREDFEAFIEMVDGHLWRTPEYNSSAIRVSFEVNGVEATLDLTALLIGPYVSYYGRDDNWNAVRLSSSDRTSIHYNGKGSRDPKIWETGEELVGMLFN